LYVVYFEGAERGFATVFFLLFYALILVWDGISRWREARGKEPFAFETMAKILVGTFGLGFIALVVLIVLVG